MRLEVDEGGVRDDRFLARMLPGRGRRLLAEWFAKGLVRVNGAVARKGLTISVGDVVELTIVPPDAAALRPVPEPTLPLEELYVDNQLLVVVKPPGWPSHPLSVGELGTLANAIVARYPECALVGNDPREAGLAHRLDSGTSGVLVCARDQSAWRALRDAFHAGLVAKEYLALVAGRIAQGGEVTVAVAHDPRDRRRMVTTAPAHETQLRFLPATTRYVPVERVTEMTLVSAATGTGRRHQVRVHLASIGHPIVGDELYGGPTLAEAPLIGHFLHAARIELNHPRTARPMAFAAQLPADREATLASLRD